MNPHADYVAPVTTGGWAQLQWYWTDTLWTGVYYGQSRVSLSQLRKGVSNNTTGASATMVNGVFVANNIAASPGAMERQQEWHVNLVYDPNPAIRLGLEYSWYQSHYARNLYATSTETLGTTTLSQNGLTSDGTVNTIRFSAQYFF